MYYIRDTVMNKSKSLHLGGFHLGEGAWNKDMKTRNTISATEMYSKVRNYTGDWEVSYLISPTSLPHRDFH